MSKTQYTSNPTFSKLAEKWPSAIVARTEVSNFTGGLVNEKTLANMDSLGIGPARVRVGRKIAYPVTDFIVWLESRATPCPDRKKTSTFGDSGDEK
ncbi:MAG: hypothetical protein WCQ99_14725 [Pseudomonadota bacterium]